MIKAAIKRMRLSEGEQGLVLAYIGVSLAGAGIAFNIVNQLEGHAVILRSLSAYDTWMVLAGALGAAGALLMGRGWMGHRGWIGIRYMIQGLVAISFSAAIIGGTLALPFYGTMFGPFLMAVNFLSHPLLAVFWVGVLIGAHGLYFAWRRERDSIFAEPFDDGVPA